LLYQSFQSINDPSFLRQCTQARSSITFAVSQTFNQISVFNGKCHWCRTDPHEARTM